MGVLERSRDLLRELDALGENELPDRVVRMLPALRAAIKAEETGHSATPDLASIVERIERLRGDPRQEGAAVEEDGMDEPDWTVLCEVHTPASPAARESEEARGVTRKRGR
jgi:hypothetical protein